MMEFIMRGSEHPDEQGRISRVEVLWRRPKIGKYVNLAVWADEGGFISSSEIT